MSRTAMGLYIFSTYSLAVAFMQSVHLYNGPVILSGRLAEQEQWERWPAKRKLVSGSKPVVQPLSGSASGTGSPAPSETSGIF